MRPSILCAAALLFAACSTYEEKAPPAGRFYYPTGIAHVRSSAASPSEDGYLYVATSNFDKRFAYGKVTALQLSALRGASTPLPALGAGADPGAGLPAAVKIEDLTGAISDEVVIQSFAGEMAAFAEPDGGTRLFLPTRSEGSRLHAIDAVDGTLTCVPGGDGKDCRPSAPSLTEWDPGNRVAKPRAAEPMGVAVSPAGDVFVAHIQPADNPTGTGENFESYVVHLRADDPTGISADSFTSIGQGSNTGSNSVAVGKRYAYLTGRFNSPTIRLVDTRVPQRVIYTSVSGSVLVSDTFNALDTRGIAVASDERRIYLATRVPDSLVVLDVDDPEGDFPTIRVVSAVAAPEAPNALALLERPGRGALVLMTCTSAGVLAVFDEDVGALVAQVPAVGSQPYGLTVDRRGNAARVFVSNFGDGSVAVVDIDDLNRPQRARMVARLGALQTCVVRPQDPTCQGVTP